MLQALAVLGSAVLGGIIGFALCSLIKAGEGISHGSKLGSGVCSVNRELNDEGHGDDLWRRLTNDPLPQPSGLKVVATGRPPKDAA